MPVPVRFVVLSVLAAEVLATVLIAQQIGALWSLLWFAAALLLGVLVIRRAGVKAVFSLRRADSRAGAVAGDTVLLFMAGVLLVVPGFLSDLVALVLLVPPIREQLRLLVVRRASRRFPRVRSTFTSVRLADGSVVIPGEVIDPRDPSTQAGQAGPTGEPNGRGDDGPDSPRRPELG